MTGPARRGTRSVVAIGGGHGLAQSLRAARRYAGQITAIVSVADDGGSSGRLRELLGIPAPGDLRRCMSALLPEGSMLEGALEYRFGDGALKDHAFGNLLIAAMAAACGDFADGVARAGALVGAVGRVLPATEAPVVLKAQTSAGELVGQVEIMHSERIASISLVPPDAAAPAAALQAIETADQIVLGPGSLFTSVLAACVVPAIRAALQRARGRRVYVANLREQIPETAGMDVAALVRALLAHGVPVDVVLADRAALPLGRVPSGVALVPANVAARELREHDPGLLGAELDQLTGL